MSHARIFAMIKPQVDLRPLRGEVITFIERHAFEIIEMRQCHLTLDDVKAFYAEHVGKPFFEAMAAYMVSGPVVGMVLECDGKPFFEAMNAYMTSGMVLKTAVGYWRHVLGSTNPRHAAPWTLRGKYGNKDGIMFQNVAHGSDSEEAAEREIALFRRWNSVASRT